MVWATDSEAFEYEQTAGEYAKAFEGCATLDDFATCSTLSTDLGLDVYEPKCGKQGCPPPKSERGAIVIIHGGGFIGGRPCDCVSKAAAHFFASRGLTAISAGYRLQGTRGLAPKGGVSFSDDYVNALGNPNWKVDPEAMFASIRDSRAAVRFVREQLGFDWIGVMGHSAGAAAALAHATLSNDEFDSDYRDEVEDPLLEKTANVETSNRIAVAVPISCTVDGVAALEEFAPRNRWTSGAKPPLFLVHELNDPINSVENSKWVLSSSGYNGTVKGHLIVGNDHTPRGDDLLNSFKAAFTFMSESAALELREQGGSAPEEPAYFEHAHCDHRQAGHPIRGLYCDKLDNSCGRGEVKLSSGGQTCTSLALLICLPLAFILLCSLIGLAWRYRRRVRSFIYHPPRRESDSNSPMMMAMSEVSEVQGPLVPDSVAVI